MSAAAALPASAPVTAGAAVGITTAGGMDDSGGVSFQMLVAGWDAAAGTAAGDTTTAATPGELGTVADKSDEDTGAPADDALSIDALVNLCAGQLPVIPLVPAGMAVAASAAGVDLVAAGVTDSLADATAGAARPQLRAQLAASALRFTSDQSLPRPAEANAETPTLPLTTAAGNPLPTLDMQPDAGAEAPYTPSFGDALLRTRKSETTAPVPLALPVGTGNDASTSVAARTSDIARTVAVPVHDAHWPEAVAAQVRWALADGVQSATLKLVPEHLGPLEVRIELKDNQINLNFGANQAETRQALEDSLPRLREVLAGAGLALGQASVQQDSRPASHSSGGSRPAVRELGADQPVSSARILLGLVDEYA